MASFTVTSMNSTLWFNLSVEEQTAESDGSDVDSDDIRPCFSSITKVTDSLDKELAASGFTRKDQDDIEKLDGFDSRGDVKVILATNKIESLDPALLRPGRIDRKIEFPLPDIKTRRRIFQTHTSRMTLADDVNLEEFVMTKDEFSGADIKAICTEAGLLALRECRMNDVYMYFRGSGKAAEMKREAAKRTMMAALL